MRLTTFLFGAAMILALPSPVSAADPEGTRLAEARNLLKKLRADVSHVPTTSATVDLIEFKDSPITGRSLQAGLTTYYRYGFVRFQSRPGLGDDITPEYDSVAILHPEAVYLRLTVAAIKDSAQFASNREFDLAPYLPGCRLFVYYRENFFGEAYENEMRVTTTERRIYKKIIADLAAHGISPRD